MKNINKVPKKQWAKWNERAREVFNKVFPRIKNNVSVVFPPQARKLPKADVRTMAWNAAWLAADAVNK